MPGVAGRFGRLLFAGPVVAGPAFARRPAAGGASARLVAFAFTAGFSVRGARTGAGVVSEGFGAGAADGVAVRESGT